MHTRCWRPLETTRSVAMSFPHLYFRGQKQVVLHFSRVWTCSFSVPGLAPPFKPFKYEINVGEPLRSFEVWRFQSADDAYPPEDRTPEVVNQHQSLINPRLPLTFLISGLWDSGSLGFGSLRLFLIEISQSKIYRS